MSEPHALELDIERVHGNLPSKSIGVYLTRGKRLVAGKDAEFFARTVLVGYFDRRCPLGEFRDAVFFAWDTRGIG